MTYSQRTPNSGHASEIPAETVVPIPVRSGPDSPGIRRVQRWEMLFQKISVAVFVTRNYQAGGNLLPGGIRQPRR